MICIEILETGERIRIENEIWVTANRNAPLITPHRSKALGVGDGMNVWSLGKLDGFPAARLITLAEYEESLTPADPELSGEPGVFGWEETI